MGVLLVDQGKNSCMFCTRTRTRVYSSPLALTAVAVFAVTCNKIHHGYTLGYKGLKENSAQGKSDPNILVITFDLQQSLSTRLQTLSSIRASCGRIIYRHTQLWIREWPHALVAWGNGLSWSSGDSILKYLKVPVVPILYVFIQGNVVYSSMDRPYSKRLQLYMRC